MGADERTSIVYVHWAMNPERVETMYRSVASLTKTAPNAETIVVHNGSELYDDGGELLLHLSKEGTIASYTRYRKNMHFGYARNDGLRRASREFIVISDNDILFHEGWLDECVAWLEKNPGNFFATPLKADIMNAARHERWAGEVDGWRLNYRAGSNCFVGRKEAFEEVGDFLIHHIAGSHWADAYTYKGYLMACMPEPKAEDLGFRKGYNIKEKIENTTL